MIVKFGLIFCYLLIKASLKILIFAPDLPDPIPLPPIYIKAPASWKAGRKLERRGELEKFNKNLTKLET